MLQKTQAQNHVHELRGIKGAMHTVEQGLKIYNSLRGVYEVGKAIYQGAQVAAPLVAGLL